MKHTLSFPVIQVIFREKGRMDDLKFRFPIGSLLSARGFSYAEDLRLLIPISCNK